MIRVKGKSLKMSFIVPIMPRSQPVCSSLSLHRQPYFAGVGASQAGGPRTYSSLNKLRGKTFSLKSLLMLPLVVGTLLVPTKWVYELEQRSYGKIPTVLMLSEGRGFYIRGDNAIVSVFYTHEMKEKNKAMSQNSAYPVLTKVYFKLVPEGKPLPEDVFAQNIESPEARQKIMSFFKAHLKKTIDDCATISSPPLTPPHYSKTEQEYYDLQFFKSMYRMEKQSLGSIQIAGEPYQVYFDGATNEAPEPLIWRYGWEREKP